MLQFCHIPCYLTAIVSPASDFYIHVFVAAIPRISFVPDNIIAASAGHVPKAIPPAFFLLFCEQCSVSDKTQKYSLIQARTPQKISYSPALALISPQNL